MYLIIILYYITSIYQLINDTSHAKHSSQDSTQLNNKVPKAFIILCVLHSHWTYLIPKEHHWHLRCQGLIRIRSYLMRVVFQSININIGCWDDG